MPRIFLGAGRRSRVGGTILRDGLKSGECAGHLRRDLVWTLVWALVWTLVWGGEGGSGFFDDGWRSAGVGALGEFGDGEQFGVAAGAVA
jgi:hypothetical protein